jgi:hypothetical protein
MAASGLGYQLNKELSTLDSERSSLKFFFLKAARKGLTETKNALKSWVLRRRNNTGNDVPR